MTTDLQTTLNEADAMLMRMKDVIAATTVVFTIAAVHGVGYSGPYITPEEIEALRLKLFDAGLALKRGRPDRGIEYLRARLQALAKGMATTSDQQIQDQYADEIFTLETLINSLIAADDLSDSVVPEGVGGILSCDRDAVKTYEKFRAQRAPDYNWRKPKG